MQTYKLGISTAALNTGLSQVQIIKSGRIRSVNFACSLVGPTAGDTVYIGLGISAQAEYIAASASPVNAACVRLTAATGTLNQDCNVAIPCDYPVQAGQSLMLNLDGTLTSGVVEMDVYVTIG